MSDLACTAELERGAHAYVGDPVDVVTGAVVDSVADFRIDGEPGLVFRRFYSSSARGELRGLGAGYRHSFDHGLRLDLDGIEYSAPNGAKIHLPAFEPGTLRVAASGHVLVRDGALLRLRLPSGAALVFEPNGAGPARLVGMAEYVGGPPIRLGYAHDGTLVSLAGPNGHEVSLRWSDGRLVEAYTRTADRGTLVLARYRYDGVFLVEVEDAYGHTQRFDYDRGGLLVGRRDRRGYGVHYAYDASGRCVQSACEDGVLSVTLEYFVGRTQVTRGDGGVWQYHYDAAGTLSRIVSPTGAERRFTPRPEDRQTVRETDGAGRSKVYFFDADGRRVGAEDSAGRRVVAPAVHRRPRNPAEYEYGGWARLPEALPEVDDARALPSAARSAVVFAAPGADGKLRPVRDLQGLLIREERDGRARRFGYDPNGNLRFRTDFDGRTTRFETASFNQRIARISALGLVTAFEYSREDQLFAVVDAGGTRTEFPRDLEGNVVAVVRGGATREAYGYDGAGKLSEKRDALGRVLFTIERGPQGEVLERRFAQGGFERYGYDDALRVVTADTLESACTFAYDGGRRTADLRGGEGIERTFDGANLTESVVLGRFRTRYVHRHEGNRRTVEIEDPTGRRHVLEDHGSGLLVRRLSSGRIEHAQFHPDGHALSKTVLSEGSEAATWTRTYAHSPEGYLLAKADSERGETRYAHDADHRVVAETLPDGRMRRLSHDVAGNLYENGQGYARYYGNRLVEANGRRFEHDHRQAIAFESWQGGSRRYHRDERDQLVRVETYRAKSEGPGYELGAPWTARYDAFGRRFEKTCGTETTRYFWDSDRLAAEVRPGGELRVYVYADALSLTPLLFVDYASVDADPSEGRVHGVYADQLGCPERIEDMAGQTVWRGHADAYGLVTVTEGQDFHQPLRWPGHLWDEELGLQYNRFRTYSPELGRYLEPDPLGRAGGHENVYAYTQNPLFRVDVCGLDPCGNGGADDDEHGGGEAKPDQEETGTHLQTIADREADGGKIPERAKKNPESYRYNRDTGKYVSVVDGPNRRTEFPSGYRESTHEAIAAAHTEEGRAQGDNTRPRDAQGPIPYEKLNYLNAENKPVAWEDLTYDHRIPEAEMWNKGATVGDKTYPPGHDTSRDVRNDFHNNPANLVPMSRSENASKGGGGHSYSDSKPGPSYRK